MRVIHWHLVLDNPEFWYFGTTPQGLKQYFGSIIGIYMAVVICTDELNACFWNIYLHIFLKILDIIIWFWYCFAILWIVYKFWRGWLCYKRGCMTLIVSLKVDKLIITSCILIYYICLIALIMLWLLTDLLVHSFNFCILQNQKDRGWIIGRG